MLGMWHEAYTNAVSPCWYGLFLRGLLQLFIWITIPYGIVQNGSICMLLLTLPRVLLYQPATDYR